MKLHVNLVILFFGVFISVAVAQETREGLFVTTIGDDTLAVESYQIDAIGVHGTSITRTPKTTVRMYSMKVDSHGMPETVTISYGAIGSEPNLTRTFHYFDDSLQVEMKQASGSRVNSANIAGRPIPFVPDIFGMWSYAIQRALAPNGTNHLEILSGTRTLKYDIHGSAPGRLELSYPDNNFGPIYATVSASGDLQKLDMTPTTDKFVATWVSHLDVDAMGRIFLAREQAGNSLGTLSPRDTAHASFNGASILIDYGRPSMRGRKVFGNIVPWNVVWRLGANAATQLVTDKTLAFGKTVVEPGTYSLFALPSQKTWMLIVNKQHGQWGTVYDQAKDLARLPMKSEHLKKPVERFTARIDTRGRKGALVFEWEKSRLTAPFTIR